MMPFFLTFFNDFPRSGPSPSIAINPEGSEQQRKKIYASPSPIENAYFQSKADQVIRNYEEVSPSCNRVVRKRKSVIPIGLAEESLIYYYSLHAGFPDMQGDLNMHAR